MSFCPWICTYCIDHITQKWRTLKVMYWKVIGFWGGPYRFTAFRACPMSFSTPPYWIGLRLFWPWLIWTHKAKASKAIKRNWKHHSIKTPTGRNNLVTNWSCANEPMEPPWKKACHLWIEPQYIPWLQGVEKQYVENKCRFWTYESTACYVQSCLRLQLFLLSIS